jgi:hypothetical protein
MAMSFGGGGGAGGEAQQDPDLGQVDTEQLGFHTISGENKLRLVPSP